ncbi:MAG: hypothetical protein K2H82_05030 [Oscillospiraceae bacterium]|nr:hypothetical protein [Oscillospiraceae bacterium]
MYKTCQCGNVLHDSIVPNSYVFHVYADPEEWTIRKMCYLDSRYYKNLLSHRVAWHCENCHKIYLWKNAGYRILYFSGMKNTIPAKEYQLFIAMNDYQVGITGKIIREQGVETKSYKAYQVYADSEKNRFWIRCPKTGRYFEFREQS